MENTQIQWHLLGAGSLGCLFAAYLRRASVPIELIVRDDRTAEQLRVNGGITLSNADGNTTIAVDAVTLDAVQAPIEYLLICTKAHQTLDAIAAIESKITDNAIIVLLQNGLGVRELLQRQLPGATILHALSTEGAFRTSRFHVTHAGRGETVIGADPSRQNSVQPVIRSLQCELPIKFEPDIARKLWLKLAVNSVINPLTAMHRCRNGELLKLENIDSIVANLCDELAQVAYAEHIDLSAEQMRAEVFRVMHATAQNKSSMLQDIEAGRGTEIDFINGFIVQRARSHGLLCTRHEQLLVAVHSLQP